MSTGEHQSAVNLAWLGLDYASLQTEAQCGKLFVGAVEQLYKVPSAASNKETRHGLPRLSPEGACLDPASQEWLKGQHARPLAVVECVDKNLQGWW